MSQAALQQYKAVGVQSGVTDASPHQLVAMLLAGAMDRVAAARGAIERGDISRKGELISGAIAIVDSLRASLDPGKGGQIADNLASLYDYIEQGLVQAGMESDPDRLNEISALLAEISGGWQSIPEQDRWVK